MSHTWHHRAYRRKRASRYHRNGVRRLERHAHLSKKTKDDDILNKKRVLLLEEMFAMDAEDELYTGSLATV